MKKLAPVNDISGVLFLVDPTWIFSPRMWWNFSSRVAAHALTKYQSNSNSGRGARASYRAMLPEISARRSLLQPSFRYLLSGREGEREMSAPRPYVTEPFRPLSSVSNSCKYNNILVISSMWYVQVCLAVVHI